MTEVLTSKDPMAEHKAVVAESDKRPPVAVSAVERDRWQARALRAEGKLAELALMLDEYRAGRRRMPTYADLAVLLQE